MTACVLVPSQINHTRHGTPSHFLGRWGLSIWIDLDNLGDAEKQSALFSVGKFNLLSFHESDYGPNFKVPGAKQNLADYARQMAHDLIPDITIETVHLLTFPRIFGLAFNPVSVYVLRDAVGSDQMYIYEVRNTFGDMHSYVGTVTKNGASLQAKKIFHVSPFFPLDGEYRLKVRVSKDCGVSVLMRYTGDGRARLTATLRGTGKVLTTPAVIAALIATGQWPMRPLLSIHVEAVKLFLKKVPFFRRPDPPKQWSKAKEIGRS